jgi:TolB-like protein
MAGGGGEGKTGGAAPAAPEILRVHSGSPDVFISYASPDSEVADAVCDALESAGVACWIAPRDVVPGEFYADAIVHAIDAAKVIVLVLSQNAVASPHVLREVERATSKRHPVVSFRIDLAPLPAGLEYFLNTSHWLDASVTGAIAALPKLVEAAKRLVMPGSGAEPGHPRAVAVSSAKLAPDPPAGMMARQRLRRPLAALIAVIAVVMAYLVVDRLWVSGQSVRERHVATPPAAAPTPQVIPDKSVAVLAFLDMSQKKDQEYFSDGLSEELIDLLTKIPGLHVTARTSSFYFKGKSEDIPTIAKRLLVAHILEGSVRRTGNRLRVTAQLVRADNGYHLWSETYDRKLDDIFKVQDEIAGAVVKALKITLMEAEGTRIAPTENSEAYTLYMQARASMLRSGADDVDQAVDYLQRAIRLDPKFALAWARLSQALMSKYERGSLPFEKARDEARGAAQHALDLDATLVPAHLAMAKIHFFDLDWGALKVETERARELDPGDANAVRAAGILARTSGHLNDAIGLFRQAIGLDPLGGANYKMLGDANAASGRYAPAELAFHKAIELAPPNGYGGRVALAQILLATGQPAAASKAFEQLEGEEDRAWGKALVCFALGRKADSDAAIADLQTRFAGSMAYEIAQAHAYRGEIDAAFAWLDRAYGQRDHSLSIIKTDWLMAKLRGDPRYEAFLRKMNLPE